MRINLSLKMFKIRLINQDLLFQFPGYQYINPLRHIIKVFIQISKHVPLPGQRNPIRKIGPLNLPESIHQKNFQWTEYLSKEQEKRKYYGKQNNSNKQENAHYHFLLNQMKEFLILQIIQMKKISVII